MESAEFSDQLMSGAKPEVVGVAENDLCAEQFEFGGVESLHAALGAHWHENRGLHLAMRQRQRAAPSGGMSVDLLKSEWHGGGQWGRGDPPWSQAQTDAVADLNETDGVIL